MRIFITSAEVAAILDMTHNSFLRVRQRLEDEDGFPEPMPHSRRPLRWRRDQVDVWIKGQGLPRDREAMIDPALITSGRVALLAEARRA